MILIGARMYHRFRVCGVCFRLNDLQNGDFYDCELIFEIPAGHFKGTLLTTRPFCILFFEGVCCLAF